MTILTPEEADARRAIVLRALDWLEAHPDRWTKSEMARDEAGKASLPHSPAAYRFCILGRIIVEAGLMPAASDMELIPSYFTAVDIYLRAAGISPLFLIGNNDPNRAAHIRANLTMGAK